MQVIQHFKHKHDFVHAKSQKVIPYDSTGNPTLNPDDLDKLIDFYGNQANSHDDVEAINGWINGLIAINAKYCPNDSEYDFIERIINKLYHCRDYWKCDLDLSYDKIIGIYSAMEEGENLREILSKFSDRDLCIYGW